MKTKHCILAAVFAVITGFSHSTKAQIGDELISAVMNQDLERVKALAENGVDLDFQEERYGSSALILACQYDMAEIGRYLIEKGANPNLAAHSGHTALMAACTRSEELTTLLLENGADPSATLPDGTTAFTRAVVGLLMESVSLKITDELLARGADVDECADSGDIAGYTCLMMAARNARPDLVRYLVDKGADVNAKAADGHTPLSLAMKEKDEEMVALLKELGAG